MDRESYIFYEVLLLWYFLRMTYNIILYGYLELKLGKNTAI